MLHAAATDESTATLLRNGVTEYSALYQPSGGCLRSVVQGKRGAGTVLRRLFAAAALSGRQAELGGAYSQGSAFLQSHLGIQSVGERSRILDTAMNPNSMYALRPNGKGIVNAWVRPAVGC